MGGGLPDFAAWSGYPSIAALSINRGIDFMCQELPWVDCPLTTLHASPEFATYF
jgi:hypothetical protein